MIDAVRTVGRRHGVVGVGRRGDDRQDRDHHGVAAPVAEVGLDWLEGKA